jgi:hypothetical protein
MSEQEIKAMAERNEARRAIVRRVMGAKLLIHPTRHVPRKGGKS